MRSVSCIKKILVHILVWVVLSWVILEINYWWLMHHAFFRLLLCRLIFPSSFLKENSPTQIPAEILSYLSEWEISVLEYGCDLFVIHRFHTSINYCGVGLLVGIFFLIYWNLTLICPGERFTCFILAALLWEIFTDDWGRKLYMLQCISSSEIHLVLMEFHLYQVYESL